MKPKQDNIHIQNICSDCLQVLANGHTDSEEHDLETMQATLTNWADTGYTECGHVEDDEGHFSWSLCDLCNGLAGTRYGYNFEQAPV